jgi:hypothetical protein
VGSVFGPIRFLLPVCRLSWFLYTLNIYAHFRHIFLSNYWWQESDIWSQASYSYPILWEAFLDPSDSYFLFADLVGFYTHWTYMHIFLSNYWWQISDIWSQASYRYPISWEVFFDPSDSYFLLAEERGYHKWALAHSSSCLIKQLLTFNFSLLMTTVYRTGQWLINLDRWPRSINHWPGPYSHE